MTKPNISAMEFKIKIKFTVKEDGMTKKVTWEEPAYPAMTIDQAVNLAYDKIIADADVDSEITFNNIVIGLNAE